MNNDRLKAGVTQAAAASALFQGPTMDIASFRKGLTAAEDAINTLKVASGMATNYPTSQPYNIKQMEPETLAAAMKSGRIEPGEGSEEDEASFELENVGNPFKEGAPVQPNIPKSSTSPLLPSGLSGLKKLPSTLTPTRPQSLTLGPKSGIQLRGGRRRTYRHKQKRRQRASTHKRRNA